MVNHACQLDGIWNPLDESVRAFPGKVKRGEKTLFRAWVPSVE